MRMVPCIQLDNQVKLTDEDLEGFATDLENLNAVPRGAVGERVRTLVVVQKLVMFTRVLDLYDLVQLKVSPTLSFSSMYRKSFIYCRDRNNYQ